MSSMVALGSVLVPRPDHEALWATTVTVPCAAHTGRPVLVMSILATPLRFPQRDDVGDRNADSTGHRT